MHASVLRSHHPSHHLLIIVVYMLYVPHRFFRGCGSVPVGARRGGANILNHIRFCNFLPQMVQRCFFRTPNRSLCALLPLWRSRVPNHTFWGGISFNTTWVENSPRFDISNQKLYVDVVFYIFIQLQQRESWVTGWATMREVS
jgi:hypothetical protein